MGFRNSIKRSASNHCYLTRTCSEKVEAFRIHSNSNRLIQYIFLQPKWKPSVSWFKNAESRLNHHLSGLFRVSSLAWTRHLVHVAIPGSRGEYVRWNNFLEVLPHPQGLGPLFTGQWNLYTQNPDSSSHLFGLLPPRGIAPSGFRPLRKIPTAASRRSLGRVSVPVWLIILSD